MSSSGAITGFRITNLHGRRDVNIQIEDDCVVLVGVNGLGKTTIVNLLYYFLTRQWGRLLEYEFDAVAIDGHNSTLAVSRDAIRAQAMSSRLRTRLARYHPRLSRTLREAPDFLDALVLSDDDPLAIRRLADQFDIPLSLIREIRHLMADAPLQQELFSDSEDLNTLGSQIADLVPGQVLYLPTYRRIERDLELLVPGLDEKLHRRHSLRSRTSAYLEFVEFGMADVERRFAEVLTSLKERARTELNSLAATYLGEVIRGEADSYDTTLIASLDDHAIARILKRVEERNFLNAPDHAALHGVIDRLKNPGAELELQERYVGHFFSKLATIHQSLAKSEAAVEAFVSVCNGYLVGKKIAFDDHKYVITVEPDEGENPLELRHLSSGEKQIVSLFTHVYLGEADEFVVLIDEPELSLSVPWQKKLLPDIRNSGRCRFLAAVTHSPFIYDNALRDRAIDLQQCVTDR